MTAEARLIAAELAGATAPCVTCSFQAEGVVLVHLLREQRADIPVLFLDTVHHFPETLAYRDELAERWKLNLIVLRADAPLPGLWRNDPDACCARHKVDPLFAALAQVAPFTLPRGKVLRKVSPLAGWSTREVWAYAKTHDIPLLPLYELGYTSIGCEPCTSLPLDPSNARSGRWGGQKLECGIHLQPLLATDDTSHG